MYKHHADLSARICPSTILILVTSIEGRWLLFIFSYLLYEPIGQQITTFSNSQPDKLS